MYIAYSILVMILQFVSYHDSVAAESGDMYLLFSVLFTRAHVTFFQK